MMSVLSKPDRYLLYIDILGFSELVATSTYTVDNLYAILDSLNVHSGSNKTEYETIVFSDTVLVYTREAPTSEKHRQDLVWFLIEFAEDLHHRLVGQNLFFRALVVGGDFSHYELRNINCFYGPALIDAYGKEKTIPSTGVFIDNKSNLYNEFFRTRQFSENLNFVYMNRNLESIARSHGDQPPFNDMCIPDGAPNLIYELRHLADTFRLGNEHPDPRVRTKHLTAWSYYCKRYPGILQTLVNNDFDIKSLCPIYNWEAERKQLEESIIETKTLTL